MIREPSPDQLALFAPEDFAAPFGGGLDPSNRWVVWAQQIPWSELAAVYQRTLAVGGRQAKPARWVLGALIIKHRLDLSDTETLEQLRENPYLQYFCGCERYQHEPLFAPTLFVELHKRLSPEVFADFEQAVIDRVETVTIRSTAPTDTPDDDASLAGAADPPGPDATRTISPSDDDASPRGTLIVDASVAEQAIRYPTDVSLLNEARDPPKR